MIQVYCTQIFNTHTKFLRQPATWQAETGLYMARLWSITLPCGNSWKWIKIAIQCTSDFRQFSSIHVISPWCIHLWIRLLALCDLDAGMHAWMHPCTAHTLWDTAGCPPLLFAEGSAVGKGTGSNLQHLVAISPHRWQHWCPRPESKQTQTNYR